MTSDKIIELDVAKEISDSFMAYSMSVIMARALPDVRDGLKPVHRRILYTMIEKGIKFDGATRKSAITVGATMGDYHPHGDSSIYEALVRMAQDFRMRVPLVFPKGNFGSLDDGPAAARYTECKLNVGGMLLLEDLREDTVDFSYNYSGEYLEPDVLPSAFPNLLVNGGTGIAVGMASNMAPHNLTEIVEGLKAMILNPNITLDEMMVHVPGPDLPGGAIVIDGGAIKTAYETGRGVFKMRAVAKIEKLTARTRGIVFTSLPFNIGGETILEKVKEKVKEGKLLGISNIKDLTNSRTGMRIVVECKTGFNPEAVLEELYRLTPLQESFGINNVCIVDRSPQTLGLLELCRHYIEHRRNVVRRRTQFRLKKAKAREHILNGLIIALASIEEVVATIRKSKDTATARTALMKKFMLSEIQADAILEMRLSRLTNLEVGKLKDELKELLKYIKELEKLLASQPLMDAMIISELEAIVLKVGTPRVSTILGDVPVAKVKAATLEVPDEPAHVALTTTGIIGRFDIGTNKNKPSKDDMVISELETTTRATIGAITNRGRLLRQNVVELPKAEGRSRGGDSHDFFKLDGEKIVALTTLEPGHVLTLITEKGAVKRVLTEAFPNSNKPGAPVIGLKDDELVAAYTRKSDAGEYDIIMVTSSAQLLRTSADSVAPKGAPAGAMAGMKVAEDARVIAVGLLPSGDETVMVSTLSDGDGFKVTPAHEYPAKGRGGAGVRCQTFKKGETQLVAARVASGTVFGVNAKGEPLALSDEVSKRDASGVKLETPIVALSGKRQE